MRTEIIFEPIMNGWKRKLTVKSRVTGYRHGETNNVHFYTRGSISYLFDLAKESAVIRKFDYSLCKYIGITYEEILKFIEITNIERTSLTVFIKELGTSVDNNGHSCTKKQFVVTKKNYLLKGFRLATEVEAVSGQSFLNMSDKIFTAVYYRNE